MTLQGSAIIFNHYKYLSDGVITISERQGTEFDTHRLKACLEKLNFSVTIHNNLKITEIKDVIKEGFFYFHINFISSYIFFDFENNFSRF